MDSNDVTTKIAYLPSSVRIIDDRRIVGPGGGGVVRMRRREIAPRFHGAIAVLRNKTHVKSWWIYWSMISGKHNRLKNKDLSAVGARFEALFYWQPTTAAKQRGFVIGDWSLLIHCMDLTLISNRHWITTCLNLRSLFGTLNLLAYTTAL